MSVSTASEPVSGPAGFDLNPVRMQFGDRAVEEDFRRERLNQSHRIVGNLIAAAVLYLAFGLLDSIEAGPALQHLWFIRYAIVFPLLLGAAILISIPSLERYAQAFLFTAMAGPGLGVIAMTALMPAPYNSRYYAGLIMVLIYGSSFFRLRFVFSATISVTLVALYQVAALHLNPIPMEEYISNDFFLVMATAVGLFSSYTQEMYTTGTVCSQGSTPTQMG